ncbi:MAG: Ribosomal protein S15P [Candidatus Methanohalarchaeum thermophilum]|uniref:Small ribosomal subunit protein uS15 n=1 Tax=Methanohalarchaeum thermophilum TaxID=1903181 RepID=A0A1Q6DV31_METT1|nr:MAG: Ribosomal protein S15P [Candidatus Methanohalarchaeum thermophilum]
MATTNEGSKPEWVDMEPEEIEDLVVELKEEGYSSSEIGMKLRDQYAIPDVREITGKKVSEILEEKDKAPTVPEDLRNLIEKAQDLREHMNKNPNDTSSKRGLQVTESKIRNLADYYKREGKLPEDWKYRPEEAELLLSE